MKKKFGGYILVGGESSRMGSPKGNLKFQGKSFIEHICQVLLEFCDEVFLVGNQSDYDHFEMKRILDTKTGIGPISGLHSALDHSSNEWNFILSCDIPTLDTSILEILLPNASDTKNPRILKDQNHSHPLLGLYPKSCIKTIENQIKNKNHKLQDLMQNLGAKHLELPGGMELLNINRPKDYQILKDEFDN